MTRLRLALSDAGDCLDAAVDALAGIEHLTEAAASSRRERAAAMLDQAVRMLGVAQGELTAALGATVVDRAAVLGHVMAERYGGRYPAGIPRQAAPSSPAAGRARVPLPPPSEGEALLRAAREGRI